MLGDIVASTGFWIEGADGTPQYITEEDLKHEGIIRGVPKPISGWVFRQTTFAGMPLKAPPGLIGSGIMPIRSKVLLVGAQKLRKSFTALQVGYHVAEGIPLWGFDVSQATSLYLQFEISHINLQGRMRLTSKNMYVGTSFRWKADTKEGMKELRTIMEATKPKLVILDCLYKMFSAGADLNSAKDVVPVLNMIDEVVLDEFQASCLLVHHENKDGGVHGTQMLVNWCDTRLALTRKQLKSGGVLYRMGFHDMRNGEEPLPVSLEFNRETLMFDRIQTKKEQGEEMIERGDDLRSIADELGVPVETVRTWKKRMKEEGCEDG